MNLKFNPAIEDNPYRDVEYPASMRPIKFQFSNEQLLGTMFLAAGQGPIPTLLLLHGFPGNETNFDIAHAVRRAGFNVFVFHYRGIAGSSGTFSWENALDDTKAALEFLKSDYCVNELKVEPSKISIAGHSMGGFLSMMCASDEITNIGYLGGFNYGLFADFIRDNDEAKLLTLQSLENSCQFINSIPAKELLLSMFENSEKWNLINRIPTLIKKNLLIVGAKYDTIAMNEIHHTPLVQSLNKAGAANLEVALLEAGHSFSDRRIELTNKVTNWLLSVGN